MRNLKIGFSLLKKFSPTEVVLFGGWGTIKHLFLTNSTHININDTDDDDGDVDLRQ